MSSVSVGRCARRARLDKDCRPASGVRRRRVPKKATSDLVAAANKTVALEEKLDGLYQLLQPPPNPQLQTAASPSLESLKSDERPHVQSQLRNASSAAKVDREMPSEAANDEGAWTPTASSYPSMLPAPLESDEECEEYLDRFRSLMVPSFPVVSIPPNATVRDMKTERPLLWAVIRAFCSRDTVRQAILAHEARRMLAETLLVSANKNLDLINGTLVLAGWCHDPVPTHNLVSIYVHIGLSIASDLGLLKSIPAAQVMMNYTSQGCPKTLVSPPPPRTIEERRAVLGLFLVGSIACRFFQRTESMRWTAHLDECLYVLERTENSPTDQLLVPLVRIQLLTNRILQAPWPNESSMLDSTSKLPHDAYIQIFESQPEEVKRSIPSTLISNVVVQSYILNAAIGIHEHSLLLSSSSFLWFNHAAQLHLVESLWTCFTAVKAWFQIFLSTDSFPIRSLHHAPMAHLCHMSHSMVAPYRLSTFESPNIPWDRRRVLQMLNLGDVLKKLINAIEAIPEAAGLEMDMLSEINTTIWCHARKMLLKVLAWWESKVAPKLIVDAGKTWQAQGMEGYTGENVVGSSDQQQTDALDSTFVDFDFLDDGWMREMLGGVF